MKARVLALEGFPGPDRCPWHRVGPGLLLEPGLGTQSPALPGHCPPGALPSEARPSETGASGVAQIPCDCITVLHLSLRREPTLPRALGLTRTRLAVFSEYVYDPSAYTRPCTVDWALGAALLMSQEWYEALGGWDETYFEE